MEMVTDYEFLKGIHETFIKEIALVAFGVIRTLHFQAPTTCGLTVPQKTG